MHKSARMYIMVTYMLGHMEGHLTVHCLGSDGPGKFEQIFVIASTKC